MVDRAIAEAIDRDEAFVTNATKHFKFRAAASPACTTSSMPMRSSAVVVAFGDAYLIFDPYPGYGILEKRRSGTYEAYIRWKNELIATLLKIRDEPIEVLEEASRDLPLRGSEHDAIFESRGNVMRLFDALSRRTAKPTNAQERPAAICLAPRAR